MGEENVAVIGKGVDDAMIVTRADLLAAVERSPQAAAAHDRRSWVGLFAADGYVEDPVGSRPHRGRDAIGRFYDTFIGPREIRFHRDVDIVLGSTVLRDLELEVTMAADLTLRIPAYLRYDLQQRDDALKIAGLRAYWELPAMVTAFLRRGLRAIPAGAQLSMGLLRNQGLTGTLGFVTALRGAGPQGRQRFAEFLDDAFAGDEVAVRRRLRKGTAITRGDDQPMSTAELLRRLAGARRHKMIGCGHTLVAAAEHAAARSVVIAEVGPMPFVINRIRYFADDE